MASSSSIASLPPSSGNPRSISRRRATRLAGVIIENLPYGEFIARYDGPGVLFYLDPPYWGSEGDYGRGACQG